jgi:hypothetical protein
VPVSVSLHCQHLVAQYKREDVSTSIASNNPIAEVRDPGHPQPPEPGSHAAGSSARRTGRNVARSGNIIVGWTNRVLITTLVLWAKANKRSSKHPTS